MKNWYTIRARATGAEVLIYDEIGAYGENIAEKYLRNKKYNIIYRNFNCRNGEIDMTLNKLITENDCQRPTYLIEELQ